MVTEKIINLNNGRSALEVGIKILSIKEGSVILIPEIICDVAIKVFLKNKLKIRYYKLNSKFDPVWSDLNKKSSSKVSCILMVHFFGYPQNIKKFKNFAKRKKIFLIEDNCHSLDLKINKRILGKNGDIGVDSPRKIFSELYSGGRLYINKNIDYKLDFLKYKPNFLVRFKKKIKNDFKKIYTNIKFLGERPEYESPFLYSDMDNNFKLKKMDSFSENYLKKINFKLESRKRVKQFKKIEIFARKNQIKPVFKVKSNLVPMCFVGITKSKKHASKLFDWGWKNKIEITSWPSFYSKLKLNKRLLNRWNKYICIPLNQNLKKI
jgi:hypothetical protein